MATQDLFANLLAYKELENESSTPDYSSVFSSDVNLGGQFENLLNQSGGWTISSPAEVSGTDFSSVFKEPASLNPGSSQFNTVGQFNLPETDFGEIAQGGSKPRNLVRATNTSAAESVERQRQRQEIVRQSPGAVNRQAVPTPNWAKQISESSKKTLPTIVKALSSPLTAGATSSYLTKFTLNKLQDMMFQTSVNENRNYNNQLVTNYLDDLDRWEKNRPIPSYERIPGKEYPPFSWEHAFDKKPDNLAPSPKLDALLKAARRIDPQIYLDTISKDGLKDPHYSPSTKTAKSHIRLMPSVAAHELGHAIDHSLSPNKYMYKNNSDIYQSQSPGIATAISYRPNKNILESGIEGILTSFGSNSQSLRNEWAADRYGSLISKNMDKPDINKAGNPIPGSEINFWGKQNLSARGTHVLDTANKGFNQGVLGHILGATADFAKNTIMQGVIEPAAKKARGNKDSQAEAYLRQFGYNPNDYQLQRNSSGQVDVNPRTSNPVGSFLMNKVWGVK